MPTPITRIDHFKRQDQPQVAASFAARRNLPPGMASMERSMTAVPSPTLRARATNINCTGIRQLYPLGDSSNHQRCNFHVTQPCQGSDQIVGPKLLVGSHHLKAQPHCTTPMPENPSPQYCLPNMMHFKLTQTPTYDLQRPRKDFKKPSLKSVAKKVQYGKVPQSRIMDPFFATEIYSMKDKAPNQEQVHFNRIPRTTNEARPVVALDPITNTTVHLFESCSEAARMQGINRTKLSRICRGGGGVVDGLMYRYQDDRYVASRLHIGQDENASKPSVTTLAAPSTKPASILVPYEKKSHHYSLPDDNATDVHDAAILLTHFRSS